MNKWISITVLSALSLMVSAGAMAQNNVTVKVENVPNGSGKVLIATNKGQTGMAQAVAGETEVTVSNVPDGDVVFYVLHDANGNMTCDMDGELPKEYVCIEKFDISKDTGSVTVSLENIIEKVRRKRGK
ncbi:putative uncharacterized protein [Prevotella sp. CAG:1124]|jgi:uncharacterized protein (DUF2141 family)|nr:putative uncharacterized protein [Prevotella sp. CAG:1124]